MFSIAPGQTGIVSALYADANGNEDPLFSIPTCVEANSLIPTFTPCDISGNPKTQTLNDGDYWWSFPYPTSQPPNTTLTINTSAEADPVVGKRTLTASTPGVTAAAEDTTVTQTVTIQ